MDGTETAGCIWCCGSSESDDVELRLRWRCSSFDRRLCADADRRRSIGKNPRGGEAAAGFSADDESDVDSRLDPDGVLIGLSANTGTSEKCSDGIRICEKNLVL